MNLARQEKCEICGHSMAALRISRDCRLLKCPQCSHITRDLELCNAQAREHAWGGSALFDRVRAGLTMRRLNRLLPKNRQLNILEIGFGSGKLLLRFLKKGHKVHGIEASAPEVHDIDRLLRDRGTLCFDEVENVQLPEEQFDLIYAIHVVEHLSDPAKTLAKCYHALRQQGLLYLITPNGASEGLALFGDRWWNLEDPTHVRFFSPNSATILLNKAGFGRTETRIPLWDSLTLEVNSLLRFFSRDSKEHGILGNMYTKLLDGLLVPFAVLIRVFYPKLSPSLEVLARKTAPDESN